ncbi:hypothetical protein DFH09DRAFT_1119361 [Mycena vulgaris]|nr:hypothetical protein DFH09DRAFT_1119361 [Mycena vulgaris]
MSNHFELYGICLGTAILTFILLSRRHRVFPPRRPIIHHTPVAIRRLLAPPTTSQEILLRSRASANARLWRAFRLTNTFVSVDPEVHSQFLSQSTALLRASQRDWPQFRQIALQAVELALPDRTTQFHTFVQTITLSTAIVGLLAPDADITSLSAHDLEAVASLITRIWILSKSPHQIPTQLLQQLNERLRPFAALNENPESSQFAARLSETSPSVIDHINESLRLYPPPARLTDFLPRFLAARIPPPFVDVEIADIESAQRSAVWGPNPDAYDAGRFLCEPARAGEVLAFGCGPLKCAAARWAPRAAAVIVGAILNRVDGPGAGHQIVRGGGIGGREGWDGWLVQNVHLDT